MFDIGIIGAMDVEVNDLVARLENRKSETISGITFHSGVLLGKRVVIAKCGIGKVFAATCAEAMIIKYAPCLIINSGVGGALAKNLTTGDIVIADKLCQHDMDTSPIGDPVGLVSGINKIWFETDPRARKILFDAADLCVAVVILNGDRASRALRDLVKPDAVVIADAPRPVCNAYSKNHSVLLSCITLASVIRIYLYGQKNNPEIAG